MSNHKIKIAVVCDGMKITGISKVIENYYINLDKKRFDIAIYAAAPVVEYYKELYEQEGIPLVTLPNRHTKTKSYYMALFKNLKGAHFDILHIHGNSMNTVIELMIGFLCGIKYRIMHCHNTRCANPIRTKILRPVFNLLCTDGYACGTEAGKWIWPSGNFVVIPNAFKTEEFIYDEDERTRIRQDLGISNDSLVIGHLGRINDQKNQLYLIDIFEELSKIDSKYVLLVVGTGDVERIRSKINSTTCKDRIILFGEISSPQKMYSAMDIFVFPSKYEGLPVVLLEAQISGLKCFVSDKVTKEVDFGDIAYLSIEDSPQIWSDAICNYNTTDGIDRKNYYLLKNKYIKQYELSDNVKNLEERFGKMI